MCGLEFAAGLNTLGDLPPPRVLPPIRRGSLRIRLPVPPPSAGHGRKRRTELRPSSWDRRQARRTMQSCRPTENRLRCQATAHTRDGNRTSALVGTRRAGPARPGSWPSPVGVLVLAPNAPPHRVGQRAEMFMGSVVDQPTEAKPVDDDMARRMRDVLIRHAAAFVRCVPIGRRLPKSLRVAGHRLGSPE